MKLIWEKFGIMKENEIENYYFKRVFMSVYFIKGGSDGEKI
jgi:hypothetical protein